MNNFNIVMMTDESTVVAEYTPEPRTATAYQSEADLEKEFIRMLEQQGYEYLPIHKEKDLIDNLRARLSELNNHNFTDTEWNYLFENVIANNNNGIIEKTRIIQDENGLCPQRLTCDNGESKNIKLIDKNNIHKNKLQVINQYEVSRDEGARHKNRYDVTILINGLPIVHIELKRRGVEIREAFNQIERYQRESFWANSGLYEYVQIFVISNGTETKYYANTTRWNITKNKDGERTVKNKTSKGFDFTSYWADANNKRISDIVDFTKTFFSKHTLLNILTKYCVFNSENQLIIMRPYQIVATERIINRIQFAENYKKYGSKEGGGYIWHTTGSGKTLTSFKTAQLVSKLDYINKVLFVVDRKDLDYQTMIEYEKFKKGSANGTKSTSELLTLLRSSDSKIIITTIQKLSNFIDRQKNHDIYEKHVVIIFDECHRSQFGDMHKKITKHFKKYCIFGFTGTPIFKENAMPVFSNETKRLINLGFLTTENIFGDELHRYTIVNAINDKNVLKFKVDYVSTMKEKKDIKDEKVIDVDRDSAYKDPERIRKVTEYILTHFNQKTGRNREKYKIDFLENVEEVAKAKAHNGTEIKIIDKREVFGFNSIFAVSSVEIARRYYNEFKKQQKNNPRPLKIAIIYSYAPNSDEVDDNNCQLDEENSEKKTDLSESDDRDFLDEAIKDYNKEFRTNYSTDDNQFQNYYRDVSLRMKNKEIDILIVVNMFLTGFDAPTLNTLWVDKDLKMHGLIQAFSRTNRILNEVKCCGNIVCFRNLRKQVDEAVALFGDSKASGIILMKSYKDYYYGYTDENGVEQIGFEKIVKKLTTDFSLSAQEIIGEKKQRDFIKLFGQFLRVRNILSSFDEFKGHEILSDRDRQDYLGHYNNLYDEWKRKYKKGELANINDDIVFEIELVKQIEVDVDYILHIILNYKKKYRGDKQKLLESTLSDINASPSLRSKKQLIEDFINKIDDIDDIFIGWRDFVADRKEKALENIIKTEHLDPEKTRKIIKKSFDAGYLKTIGCDFDEILPPCSRFSNNRNCSRAEKKKVVKEKLLEFFNVFFDIG